MIIFRYLAKEILITMLAATLILLALFITNQSLQFLQRAALGQLPATELLHAIALQVPLLVPYLLPLALYLGVLLTLSRMYLDSEMAVLSACGVSRAKITTMIFVIAFCVAIVVAWLMAVVVPRAQGDLNSIVNKSAVNASVQQVIPGRFMVFLKKTDTPIVFYAKRVENHAVLHDVFLAQKSKDIDPISHQHKWNVIVAKTGLEKKISGQDGRYLIFNDGYRYSGVPGDQEYRVLKFKQYGEQLAVHAVPNIDIVQHYSFPELWSLSPKNVAAAAELQWRMAMPISVLVFALLAVPLSQISPRHGKFTQLLPAILIYMCYADFIFLARSWIRNGRLSPELGMWWVHGIALSLAIILMLYRMGWQRVRRVFTRNKFA